MGSWSGEGGADTIESCSRSSSLLSLLLLSHVYCLLMVSWSWRRYDSQSRASLINWQKTQKLKTWQWFWQKPVVVVVFLVKLKVNVEDVLRELKIQWASCVCGPEAWGYEAAQYIHLRQRGHVQKRILLKGHYVGLKSKFESSVFCSGTKLYWYLLPHLEVCRVVSEMLLHTHTELVHPLPLSLQGCAVCLITCRERVCHTEVTSLRW